MRHVLVGNRALVDAYRRGLAPYYEARMTEQDTELERRQQIIELYERQLAARDADVGRLWDALAESVKLQAHYASLLNMHDGGQRLIFPTVEAWLARLHELKTDAAAHG